VGQSLRVRGLKPWRGYWIEVTAHKILLSNLKIILCTMFCGIRLDMVDALWLCAIAQSHLLKVILATS